MLLLLESYNCNIGVTLSQVCFFCPLDMGERVCFLYNLILNSAANIENIL
ncbi:hypothetical protein HMPREF6485_2356 [Segatella buccae ATCC 33574]|uniref:Uncharacterized protein n=1 Tax=Segatella buccae ATCC 33574 TaxID=873513 RepID=E6K9R2_9BACT|nr:hypothetical protein HMPREF6485_2356 [Segatella buccae ATCC 33574]